MQQLAQRATTLTPSLTLAIDAKAKKLKADGVDVCGFGAGEPDFDTPQHIKDAATQALAEGFTKYTPSSGIPELRAAIAEKLKADNGLNYKPSQVIVNCGAKHSCYNALVATCQAGDEVYALTLTVNGFSKAYSMTGWRLGYVAAPESIAVAVDSIQSHSTSNPTSFAQKGALAALKGDQSFISDMHKAFVERRAYMHDRLTKIPGITCVKPMGAFYMLPNISKFGLGSENFCGKLLD